MRKLVVAAAVVSAMVFTSNAGAAITEVFDGHGDIACAVQGPGATEGQRWCGTSSSSLLARSTARTFDGVPIDVNVGFPKAPASGPDGPYPLVMIFPGYPMPKIALDATAQRWLTRGYAVFTLTDRGLHQSCGDPLSRLADIAGCAEGYVRLMDTRYEVRDAQYLTGLLADEGLIQPKKIASTGGSYGGALTMALAALRNRTMMPDGSLVPWTSPQGKAMEIAVATPQIPWTDLAYSLVPNGSTIDYLRDSPYYGRFGVMKESWVNTLYTLGLTYGTGFYVPQGQDDAADLTGWKALFDAGEPYDDDPAGKAILNEVQQHHSSYYIDHSIPPAPLFISSGFPDDLFPVDEVTRFYNRTRHQYPDAPMSLFFNPNSGHFRGMSKADVTAARNVIEDRWIDYYLTGAGGKPANDVVAYRQTCPANAPAGAPYVAKDWASIAPGEIRITQTNQTQTVGAQSGDPAVAGLFNPSPTGMACTSAPGGEEAGSANWELPAAPAGGYTVLGAPTVVADITLPGDNSQIAARLVDVAPNGLTKLLVARGLWRPAKSGTQVFQLHANAYPVAPGHVLRLELLARDASVPAGGILNYGRPSNGQVDATIRNLDLRVPVAEQPGTLGDLVTEPAPKVLPDRPGVALAPGYGSTGSVPIDDYVPPVPGAAGKARPSVVGPLKVRGKKLKVKLRCGKAASSCPTTSLLIKGSAKARAKGRKVRFASGRRLVVKPGKTKVVTLKLTSRAKKLFKKSNPRGLKKTRAKVTIRTAGLKKKTVSRVIKR